MYACTCIHARVKSSVVLNFSSRFAEAWCTTKSSILPPNTRTGDYIHSLHRGGFLQFFMCWGLSTHSIVCLNLPGWWSLWVPIPPWSAKFDRGPVVLSNLQPTGATAKRNLSSITTCMHALKKYFFVCAERKFIHIFIWEGYMYMYYAFFLYDLLAYRHA